MGNRTNIFILCFLVCALCLVACRPRGILSSRQMRELLVDLHKTDAIILTQHLQYGHDEEKAIYYAQVLEKHSITQAQFDSSLVWYTAHPQLFDKIYPKVVAQIVKEKEAFIAMNESELDLLPGASDQPQRPQLTHAQLDSMLWVTQHGYPSPWQPLMHDTEDQLFPQVSVLR